MSITLTALQKQRTDTAANWTSANPTLLSGELGFESDTGKAKLGTGSTAWNSLGYLGVIPSSGTYPLSQLIMPLGTAGAPPLTFVGDVNTGIFSSGADQVSVSTGGTERLRIDSTGQIEAVSLGTAAAPTYTFTGDPNTGIFSPGADQVAVATNGVQRLTTDTTAVTSTLPVVHPLGAAGTPSITFTGDLNTGIYSPGADQVAISTGGSGRLRVSSTGTVEIVGAGTIGSTQAVSFNGSAPVNSMTLDSSGRLGVGISSPSYLLDLDGTTSAAVLQLNSNNATFGVSSNFKYNGSTIGSIGSAKGIDSTLAITDLGINSAANIDLCTGYTKRVRIDSSGRVGIGTSTPGVKVDIVSENNTSLASVLRVNSNNVAVNTSLAYDGLIGSGELYVRTSSSSKLYLGTNNSNAVTIDASQRVGIGTTSPGAALDVAPDANRNLQVQGKSGTTYGLEVKNGTANSGGEFHVTAASSGGVVFNRGTTEMGRFDSSSRLLVGTSSNLSNAIAVIQGVAGDPTTTGVLAVRYGSSRPAGADTLIGAIRFESTSNTASNYNYAQIRCETDGASSSDTDIPGRLVFSTTADGASTPTERLRINNEGYATFVAVNGVQVNSSIAAAGTTHALFEGKHSGTAGSPSSGTQSIRIFTNGDVQNTNNSYTAISDIKLKENIVDANSQWDDLKALQVRNYNLKEGQTHKQIGLIAQEVEPISPGLVYESPDRDAEGNDLGTVTKSVNYSVLYMKAVKALQEAMERIEQLETEMAAVKAQLS